MHVGRQFDRQTVIRAFTSQRLRKVELGDMSVVAPGGTANIYVTPEAGVICHVVAVMCQAPAVPASASGTHQIDLCPNMGQVTWTQCKMPYNAAATYTGSAWTGAPQLVLPSDPAGQALITEQMWYDANVAFRMKYSNNTNVNQTAERILRLVVIEEVIS